jgi:hypothetical protein
VLRHLNLSDCALLDDALLVAINSQPDAYPALERLDICTTGDGAACLLVCSFTCLFVCLLVSLFVCLSANLFYIPLVGFVSFLFFSSWFGFWSECVFWLSFLTV